MLQIFNKLQDNTFTHNFIFNLIGEFVWKGLNNVTVLLYLYVFSVDCVSFIILIWNLPTSKVHETRFDVHIRQASLYV